MYTWIYIYALGKIKWKFLGTRRHDIFFFFLSLLFFDARRYVYAF